MTTNDGLVTLRRGGFGLLLCPAAGGSIARYWQDLPDRTIEWLRPATAAAIAARDPLRMASFPLVPFSGRVRAGRFSFDGREIALPLNFPPERNAIHGQGWQAPWRVAEAAADRATLAFAHAAGDWPWAYSARQEFALEADGALALAMSITNEDERPMPAGLGPHPYFVRTPGARVAAAVEAMWDNDAETMPVALIPPPPAKDLTAGVMAARAPMDNLFTGWNGTATVEWPEWNARLTLEAPPPLRFLVVYTPPGEDFFCVEPVGNIADAFNLAAGGRADTGLTVLQPGETLAASVRFVPELG